MAIQSKWVAAILVVGALGVGLSVRGWFAPLMSQRSVLENSDKFVLYSLWSTAPPESLKLEGQFHGFGILGQKEITDPKLKARLVEALYDGLNVPEDYAPGDCFFPGYGIRALKGGRTIDVGLCYGCGTIEFYENGDRVRLPTTREVDKIFKAAVVQAKLRREADVPASE